jgi:hypothetical protein
MKSHENLDQATIDSMMERGEIQVSSCFENAVAEVGGYDVVRENARDFNDPCNSDAKLSSVRTSNKVGSYSAAVSNVHTKVGNLRVQVYERILNKFYYFNIPRHAYEHIKSTSNIDIPFDQSGLPKRNNSCRVNWWNYEEPTFEDMARNMTDPMTRRIQKNEYAYTGERVRSGGRIAGYLSQTPAAVKRRAERAAARDPKPNDGLFEF